MRDAYLPRLIEFVTLKRQAIIDKKNVTLIRITRNKIKNEHKARGVAACKLERERKKKGRALAKSQEFIPLELLEPILDLELSITEADIDLELCERLISNPAAIGLDVDSILRGAQILGSNNEGEDEFVMQADYISFSGLGNDFMEWDNFLDADESAEINLF